MKPTADTHDYSAPVYFSPSPVGKNGAYVFYLGAYIVTLILQAYNQKPWPTTDGEIAGLLPDCNGSSFVTGAQKQLRILRMGIPITSLSSTGPHHIIRP